MTKERQDEWTEKDQDEAARKGQGAEIGGRHSGDQAPDRAGTKTGGAGANNTGGMIDKASQGSSGGTSGGKGGLGGAMTPPETSRTR